MKTTRQLLFASALLLLCAYSFYTTVRIQRLENRQHQVQLHRPDTSQIIYAFDDSFRKYFGEKGVAEVERATQILQTRKVERVAENDDIHLDFLSDPPRLDDRKE